MSNGILTIKESVKKYLDNRAKTDELFAQNYAKPNKNFDECYNYVLGEAYHHSSDVGAHIDDEVVYGWAVHYYDEDDIKIRTLPKNIKASDKASVELTKEDYQKAYDQAMEEYKAQCLAEIKAKEEAKAKKEKEKRAALIAKRKEQENMTLSLFDF